MEYPKENIVILCHLKGGGRTKGFFYMNGTKPTFAAYGSEITDKVIGWEYIRPAGSLVGKKFRGKINGAVIVVKERITAENGQDYYITTDEFGERKQAHSCRWFENGLMQNLEEITE